MEYRGVGRYRHRVSGVPWCRPPGTFLSGRIRPYNYFFRKSTTRWHPDTMRYRPVGAGSLPFRPVSTGSLAVSACGIEVQGCRAVSAWGTVVLGGIGMEYHGVGRHRHGVPWCWAVSAWGVGVSGVPPPRNFFKWSVYGPIFIFSERVVQGGTPTPCGIGRLVRVASGVDRLVRVAWPIWHGFWAIKGVGPNGPLEHVNSRWRSA